MVSAADPVYHAVQLDEHGALAPEALAGVVAAIRQAAASPRAQIVVVAHGYNTSQTLGKRQYRQVARELRTEARAAGWEPIVIGVHWPSHPGSYAHWLPRMLGYRFISGTGFPNALSNPYLDKVRMAQRCGRSGFRSLLLRLQEAYPKVPVNVLAHSLGCELTVRALVPESLKAADGEPPIERPEIRLHLGMVALAGADIDQNAFAPQEDSSVAAALDQAQLWWITVPRHNSADAALELRRTAGRRDAMGNVGLELVPEQLERLVRRRALVIDSRRVPITHDLLAYYTEARTKSLVEALNYLVDPKPGKGGTLELLDQVLLADPQRLPDLASIPDASVRLYARWRQDPARSRFGYITVLPRSVAIPAAP
jgi:hypothetical protein